MEAHDVIPFIPFGSAIPKGHTSESRCARSLQGIVYCIAPLCYFAFILVDYLAHTLCLILTHNPSSKWRRFEMEGRHRVFCVQNSFMLDVRNADTSDQDLLSVNVSGPMSRLPVSLTWRNANRCQCDFTPVEPGRHTVRYNIISSLHNRNRHCL